MDKEKIPYSLNSRITRLRWQVPIWAFFLVLIHQIIEHTVLLFLPRWYHFASQFLFYGLIGPVLAWWALTYIGKRVNETDHALTALNEANEELSETSQRLEFLIRVNHRLAEPEDEESLINIILDLAQEVVPIMGCSLVRFDSKDKPITAVHRGGLDPDVYLAWADHLSSAKLKESCKRCSSLGASNIESCPIMDSANITQGIKKVYCLELIRGGHKFANLILYLNDTDHPTSRQENLLLAMTTEMSLALESLELHSREFGMLHRLQQARNIKSLQESLNNVITQLVHAFSLKGGAIFITERDQNILHCAAKNGDIGVDQLQLLQGMAKGVIQTAETLRISEVNLKGVKSLLIIPLNIGDRILGSMALWSAQKNTFTNRQERMIETVANQTALSIENHHLYLEASFQAGLSERARLGREIHDGLAQTIGYLKLRTGQIVKWLKGGENIRSQEALEEIRQLLTSAYTDAREAIDGLRMPNVSESNQNWLEQILLEFEQISNIKVAEYKPITLALLPEVQAQLQRIIQEALSNVRKYSKANSIRFEWSDLDGWLEIRISDDGVGFVPDDISPLNRHGLRIMRERAELLDGKFQIMSNPNDGTVISLAIPMKQNKLSIEK